jgi:hypothetical protein
MRTGTFEHVRQATRLGLLHVPDTFTCLGGGPGKVDCGGPTASYCRERQLDPNLFDPKSFRTIQRGRGKHSVRLVLGCPKGHWDGTRCDVGMRAQTVLRPLTNPKCSVCEK